MASYDHKRFLKLYDNQAHHKQKRYLLSHRVLITLLNSYVIVKKLIGLNLRYLMRLKDVASRRN